MNVFPLNVKDIASRLDAELLGVREDRRSSSAARLATAMMHQPLDRLVDGKEFPGTAVPVFFSLHGLAGNARDRFLVVLDIASSVAYPTTVRGHRQNDALLHILEYGNIHQLRHHVGNTIFAKIITVTNRK